MDITPSVIPMCAIPLTCFSSSICSSPPGEKSHNSSRDIDSLQNQAILFDNTSSFQQREGILQPLALVSQKVVLLWMDEILHHFETMQNHCWYLQGNRIIPGFLRLCVAWISRNHPQYQTSCQAKTDFSPPTNEARQPKVGPGVPTSSSAPRR